MNKFMLVIAVGLILLLLGITLIRLLSRNTDGNAGNDVMDAKWKPIRLTVSGTVVDMDVLPNRPGTVLVLGCEGTDVTGRYYVEKQVHDCRREFPAGTKVRLTVEDHRAVNGVFDAVAAERAE